jgi:CheY-like chemotaxis protein
MARPILIADPDVSTLELAMAVLTRNGFGVLCTNDGGDALARFFESSPSVVICDAELPVLNGAQLCRHIREHQSDTRVILLRSPGEHNNPVDSDFDAVLERPFRFAPIKELLLGWGLLIEAPRQRGETLEFGIPPAPPSSLAGKVEIPADAIEAVTPEPTANVAPVPVPALAELTPTDAAPGVGDDAPAAAPVPIPVPVPDAQPEVGLELDASRVTAAETSKPTSGKGLPPSVPRVGQLSELSLPRLLFELYVGTYSGKLVLQRSGSERRVFFWAGQPVLVDSDQLEERLGPLLRDEGRITEAQYEHAKAVALERGVRVGEALVNLGHISGADLLEALNAQTEKKLINTLAWRDGTFELVDDTGFASGEILTDVQPLKVIWRGVHEHYDLTSMIGFFARLRERYVVATELFAVQFEALGPHLRDLGVVSWLNGKTTFEEALRSNDARALEIAQALYVLLATDMIRASPQPGEPAPVIEHRPAEVVPAAPVDYQLLMEVSNRVAREYLRIKGKDHYAVLGVARDADTATIDAAFQDAVATARKDLERPGLPHETRKRTREIIDILTGARAVLLQPDERRVYDEELSDAGPGEAPAMSKQRALFGAEQAYREGVRLLDMLDARGARKQFIQALAGNPAEPTYRVAVAQAILVEQKDDPVRAHAAAFAYIDDALRIDPGNIPANLEMARLFAEQKLPEQARTHLERVLQRAPHHQKARRLLGELDDS